MIEKRPQKYNNSYLNQEFFLLFIVGTKKAVQFCVENYYDYRNFKLNFYHYREFCDILQINMLMKGVQNGFYR